MENNIIAKATEKQQKKPMMMADYVKSMAPGIKAALPSVMTPERFTRMTLSAISSNPKLQECTPQSFLGAMMSAAQLGLEPNTVLGESWLLPYNNHGRMEASFQLGYKGLITLAYRSGDVQSIDAQVVYENDTFEYELGLEPKLLHKPAMKDRGNPIAYYAVYRTKTGGYCFQVMSVDDVSEHAKRYSKSYGSYSSPWKSNFDEMAKKTVLKRVLKYAPLKSDFARAVAQDGTIKTEISDDMTEIPGVVIDTETGEVIESEESKNEA